MAHPHPKTLIVALSLLLATGAQAQRGAYVPPAGQWERRAPAQAGMDAARVDSAIAFAIASEARAPRDLEMAHFQTFGREPFGEPVGPFQTRGAPSGIILRHGYIVAEWGEPDRVDMTFSVTKSFLSTVVGVAVDRGLIRSVSDPVEASAAPVFVLPPEGGGRHAGGLGEGRPLVLFDTDRERRITWNDLLRQTSDWEGTLWGKPDWADRPAQNPAEWLTRPRAEPGATYEYNDTRVNLLALAALNVWRRPLPQVLRDEVMNPIGASSSWRWVGYENSWVLMDGQAVQSVSGGGHWGGGMFISARDMARFGLLTLRRGRWGDRQVLSEAWVRGALTPTPAQPTYGYMNWFLNTDRKLWPSAPATAFAHLGNGTNIIYVDPEHDVVVVSRWIENAAVDGLVQRVLSAITDARR
ncbi:serine hydrolase [Longimicrobium terrae]|uniref:CubicO group peptidase (Beta-lactamase class C family) n=1 Tax=Longimicrobium terrae TaxID=1639882 RepID=A0A841GQN3_9BACT|nr:CubicO group peptidase (beta-lactamase class C family) [Longimicrobium terrae]MBB6069822.1 CubicO group peptidase (beta-lactamase class C family) [Longimicrobium terrae]